MKKAIALILVVMTLAAALAACDTQNPDTPDASDTTTPSATSPTTPSTTPSDTTAPEKDPTEGKTAAEVLAGYFAETIKKNPDAAMNKLANIFAMHPYLDALTLDMDVQSFSNDRQPYIFGFAYGTEFPAFDSVSTIYSLTGTPYVSCIFKLKDTADAGAFVSFLRENADPDSLGEQPTTQLETAVEGSYVFIVMCTDIKIDLTTPQPETAVSIMKRLRVEADIDMGITVVETDSESASYYTGLDKTVPLVEKSAAVCEPSMGGGFSVVIVKVKDAKDVKAVAEDMHLNPEKWICMRAESVKVTYGGQYVLGVIASEAECTRIAGIFEGLFK